MKTERYLLDTHTFLWYVDGIPLKHRALLESAALSGELFFSTISCWEIGVLYRKGRIQLLSPFEQWIGQALRKARVTVLELSLAAAVRANCLPAEFHRDPADRLLVASAITDDVILVTRDQKILQYGRDGHVRTLTC